MWHVFLCVQTTMSILRMETFLVNTTTFLQYLDQNRNLILVIWDMYKYNFIQGHERLICLHLIPFIFEARKEQMQLSSLAYIAPYSFTSTGFDLLVSVSGTNTPVHSLQNFKAHDHFGKFDIFVRSVTSNLKYSIFSTWVHKFYI